MVKILYLVPILYCISLVYYVNGSENRIKTPQGTVRGYYKRSFGGRQFLAFEGIPYAKPPVGNLRFAEPEPADKWTGQLIGNRTYVCLAYLPLPGFKGIIGAEDCLYLYVYVPLTKIKGDENLDVVVHIHGGAYQFGAPSMMANPDFIMDQDVVYVSFNYRLSILGFLSTEDNVVSGNNGLKDQVLALKWIKDNIKFFGGNPNSVTITGSSAGASSVHHHYFSPLSKGLFHRGFSQSGTAFSPWSIVEYPLKKANEVAGYLNCSSDSTKDMVDCLKKVSSVDLLNAMTKLFRYLDAIPLVIFGPVIENGENPFLADHPYKLIKKGKINDAPWVTSSVKDEGIFPTVCVAHGDDGGLIFKVISSGPILDPQDEKFMKHLTKFVADYAKTGKPSISNVEWLPVDPDSKEINTLEIDSPDKVFMTKMEHIGAMEFWDSLPIKENEKLYPELR
ncbi:venom carboxylesterase-6-like isoform X3 [Diabrotica virgifera virgifera]|uniref:Carboxylic ester hydrolase n=1 Tax=Diabrotica virgifera virgifera TaxID=50390 RepID=A0ABM5KII4_DIAVI|nr:venom carboxylesterase-6-like isoform X3 [Diabrotica virgifera virgifera]